MRVLFYSPAFLPMVGGLENTAALLAEEFVRLGQEVTVVTQAAARGADNFPYRVVRRPGPAILLRTVRSCDVFFQFNVSLRGLWPLVLARRPWAVSHQGSYRREDGRIAWQDKLKRRLLRFAAVSITCSQAVAADLAVPTRVIPNPYRDDLFRLLAEVPRSGDLAFAGRLVSVKGGNLLIAALARLAREGLRPRLTVIGDGPELPALRVQATSCGLAEQVEFIGLRTGQELVRVLNGHRILVVPSLNEPFGIVALEGIACGCAVVGSSGGGLPDAIGPCGRTFRNGSIDELAHVLGELLRNPNELEVLRARAPEHLASHGGAAIARRYLAALEEGLAASRPRRDEER
jgi:glycosyltransferase involved in cell wall biosynthesis